MNFYLVTVKLPKQANGHHDPKNKKTGMCVFGMYCTDVTGEHHTILVESRTDDFPDILEWLKSKWHITRVETIYSPLTKSNIDELYGEETVVWNE